MSTAEHSRAYRQRKGANVGGRRGPAPNPCGTPGPAGYKRHLRRGEPIDDACRQAYNEWHANYQRERRRNA